MRTGVGDSRGIAHPAKTKGLQEPPNVQPQGPGLVQPGPSFLLLSSLFYLSSFTSYFPSLTSHASTSHLLPLFLSELSDKKAYQLILSEVTELSSSIMQTQTAGPLDHYHQSWLALCTDYVTRGFCCNSIPLALRMTILQLAAWQDM